MSEYTEQAEQIAARLGVSMLAQHKGDRCPMWCDGKHVHGDRYRVTLKRGGSRYSFDFWNSKNDSEQGKRPELYDVLAAVTKYDPGTFEEFCGEFGYDPDSRRAETTYRAVVREWREIARLFPDESERELLAEIA